MTEVVKIDKFGKIFLPKFIREKVDTSEFEVHFEDDELHLKPIKHPTTLFGTLKNLRSLDDIHGEDEHDITD